MKIGIDISSVIYGTGVSVYTKNLVAELLKLDTGNEYVLYGGSLRRLGEIKSFVHTLHGNFKFKALFVPPALADLVWNRLHVFPVERLVGKIDVFHSSDWTQPPSKAFKVTTVHDLIPILHPEYAHPGVVSVHKARLKWVLKEADRVIVPTVTTSDDLVKLGFEKDKIRIIPEAVDRSFKLARKVEIERVKTKLNLKTKYLLSVGVGRRKNTDSIIKAFQSIKDKYRLSLVVIGYPYQTLRSAEGVIFTGHLDQKLLPGLYGGAEALVYPSLYEGFGLPILEAYSCGVPVVTSNFGSMAEIAGKAAVLVNPESIKNIASGIVEAFKYREKLVTSGLKEAERYTWSKTALATLNVYNEKKLTPGL